MSPLESLVKQPRNRKIAVILALLGTVTPLAGLHKFYLRQPLWGVVYLLLRFMPLDNMSLMLQSACAFEAVWYLMQHTDDFDRRFNLAVSWQPGTQFNTAALEAQQVENLAESLRQLEQLRTEGLLSEYEFEIKRRQLIDPTM